MLCNYNWYNTCPEATMRVCMTFYRTIAFPLIGISLISAHQVWQSQTGYFVFRVFWVKIITSLIIGTYVALFRNEQFVFYNNLGYSRASMLLYSFGVDFLIWLLIIVIVCRML